MTDIDKRARMTGLVYVAASLPAFFAWGYVAGRLTASGDPAATLARIQAHETLFRLGVAAEIAGAAAWIAVPLAFARLFADGDRGQRRGMVILGLMTVPIFFFAVVPELVVLSLIGEPHLAGAFPAVQQQALAGLLIRAHGAALLTAQVFWGLWLFPLAALIWKSGFMPRYLAILPIAAGVGWLADVVLAVAVPGLRASLGPLAAALAQGELPLILWLIVFGTGSWLPFLGRRTATAAPGS